MTRAYCSEFVICTKKAINTIEEAEAYVRKEIMDTAMVIEIRIKEEGVETVIKNENYTDPSIINIKTMK
jgi:hypothetical protein